MKPGDSLKKIKLPRKSRFFTLLTAYALTFAFAPVSVSAARFLPYVTYNYDYREYVVYTPAAYVPDINVSGVSLGVGDFLNPQGLCVDGQGNVYIADTGNNRVIITDAGLTAVISVIGGLGGAYPLHGAPAAFSNPSGLFIASDGLLYVADTGNSRIVALSDYLSAAPRVVKIIENPVSDVLSDNFAFSPLKVAVDYAGRVFVVAKGMFQGLMVFDPDGAFTGFFGTIEVTVSAWQKFWRFFSTKEERANQALFIPTEFTGVDIDGEGFVYASHLSPDQSGKQAARRLNPRGQDVIRKGVNGHLGGDIQLGYGGSMYSGPSNFVDICVRDKGCYSLFDSRRGRIFTYDSEGNILYVFGGLGSQAGTFRIPAAIAAQGSKILALDSYRGEIQLFKETNYGRLINEAVGLRYDGDEKQAVERWRQVLKYDENFELANVGIGKSYLTAGQNAEAMKYLRLGMSRDYYSIAFKRFRNDFLKQNLPGALTAASAVIASVLVSGAARRFRKKDKGSLPFGR